MKVKVESLAEGNQACAQVLEKTLNEKFKNIDIEKLEMDLSLYGNCFVNIPKDGPAEHIELSEIIIDITK